MRYLLARGACPNKQDTNGNTVLHIMVIHDKLVRFKLLVWYDCIVRNHALMVGTFINDNGNNGENFTKIRICSLSNFIGLIPTLLVCHIL